MSAGPSHFRKTDARRLIDAVEMAGKKVKFVECDGSTVRVYVADDAAAPAAANPWDEATEQLRQ